MHHHHHAVAAYRAARELGREVLPPTGGAWVWRSRALVARVDLTAEADEARLLDSPNPNPNPNPNKGPPHER